jgi:hypothetical protein
MLALALEWACASPACRCVSPEDSALYPCDLCLRGYELQSAYRLPSLGYGLDDRGFSVRLPSGAGDFSLHRRIHNGSEAHPASYPMGTRGFFPGGKAAGA